MSRPLASHWQEAWRTLGVEPPVGWLGRLEALLAEPHRAYHNVDHVADCLAHLDAHRHRLDRPGEVGLAIFFHDATYDPTRPDNEVRSAELAAEAFRDAGPGFEASSGLVRDLILATRHDAIPESPDARLLVDIDLSILAASADRFDAYERQIRAEYAFVADDAFRGGRAAILRRFLDRPSIFLTEAFRHLEPAARSNLARSIARLEP